MRQVKQQAIAPFEIDMSGKVHAATQDMVVAAASRRISSKVSSLIGTQYKLGTGAVITKYWILGSAYVMIKTKDGLTETILSCDTGVYRCCGDVVDTFRRKAGKIGDLTNHLIHAAY